MPGPARVQQRRIHPFGHRLDRHFFFEVAQVEFGLAVHETAAVASSGERIL